MTSETKTSFFDEVQQLYRTGEDVLASLRCHTHTFKDLPKEVDPVEYILSHADFNSKFRDRTVSGDLITAVLRGYLEQTPSDEAAGLTDFTDQRTSKDAIQRNISHFPHQVALWNKHVYNSKKQAIDAAAVDLEQRLFIAAAEASRSVIEKDLYSHLDRGTFADAMTEEPAFFTDLLAAAVSRWKSTLYRQAKIARENPSLLYQLSFNAVVEQRGWQGLKDDELISTLTVENVPLEVFAHYTDRKITAVAKAKEQPAAEPLPPRIVGGPLSQVQVRTDDGHLVFENIVCHDAGGTVTEQYPSLRVRRNVYHGADGKMIFLKPYEAIDHAQEQGDFNPSSQLAMALLIAAYRGRENNPDVNAFFQQYHDKGNGNGYHVLNTITQWQRGQARLIHYPHLSDFPEANRGTRVINQSRQRRVMEFAVDNSFGGKLVSEVSASSRFGQFLRNWYGLPDLGIVVEIGTDFSKPAKAWVPNSPTTADYTSGAWLGCGTYYFILFAIYFLDCDFAARGVREGRA